LRKLHIVFGVVTVAVLALAPSALARQRGDSAAFARGSFLSRILSSKTLDGPTRVFQTLPWSPDHGGGRDHGKTFKCDGTFTGITVRDLVVGPSGACSLTDSVIWRDVNVQSSGDFEAGNTSIGRDVDGDDALTIYLRDGSNVGGHLKTRDTAQVFAFDSTVGQRITVTGSTNKVFLCHNTVGDGIAVLRSGTNILVGNHLDPNCPGNVVRHGNIVVSQNATDVELVVGDNSVPHGSMLVTHNTGTAVFTSGESVLGNQGGDRLTCYGNASPFVGSPNPGWSQHSGQCSA
jgi:hypothetical protein